MNALKAGLKTAWKYFAWTAIGAIVVAAADPEYLAAISVPVVLVPIIGMAGKSLITYITIKIKECKP